MAEWRYFSRSGVVTKDKYTRGQRFYSDDEPIQEGDLFVDIFVSPEWETKLAQYGQKNPANLGYVTQLIKRIAAGLAASGVWEDRAQTFWRTFAGAVGQFYKSALLSLLGKAEETEEVVEATRSLSPQEAEAQAFSITRQFASFYLTTYISLLVSSLGAKSREGLSDDIIEALYLRMIFPRINKYKMHLNALFNFYLNNSLDSARVFAIGQKVFSEIINKVTEAIVRPINEMIMSSYATEFYSKRRMRNRKGYRNEYYSDGYDEIMEDYQKFLDGDKEDDDSLEELRYDYEEEDRLPEATSKLSLPEDYEEDEDEDEDEDRDEVKSGKKIDFDLEVNLSKVEREFSKMFSGIRTGLSARLFSESFLSSYGFKRYSDEYKRALRSALLKRYSKYFATSEEAEKAADDVIVVLDKAQALDIVDDLQSVTQKAAQLMIEEASTSQENVAEVERTDEKFLIEDNQEEDSEDVEEEETEGEEETEEGSEEEETEEETEGEEEEEEKAESNRLVRPYRNYANKNKKKPLAKYRKRR